MSMKPTVSAQDQLEAVQRLLGDFHWARSSAGTAEQQTFFALKALVTDLKARLPSEAEAARRELGRLVAYTVKTGTPMGYEQNHLVGIGQFVMGNWPILEHALEQQAGKEAQ